MKYTTRYCALALASAVFLALPSASPVLAVPNATTTENPANSTAVPVPKDTNNFSFGDYLSGRFAESSGDSDRGVKFLRESLAHDPNNTDIMLNLYHALVSAGNIEEAVKLAKKLDTAKVADESNEFPPQFLLMLDAAKQNHYQDAQAYLQSVPKAGFNSLLIPLLEAWLKLGNGEIKAPLDAKDIMPNGKMLLPHVYLNAAFIDEIAGFNKEALQQYETAAHETRLESLRAAEALANYYMRKGDKSTFKQFVGDYKAVHGESILDEEVFSRQEPPAPLVNNVNDGLAEAFYTIASIFHGIRSPSEEIITLKMALYLRPDFPAARFLLAGAYELLRSFDAAIKEYKTIESASAYYTQSLIMIAYDKSELGQKDEAIADLDALAKEKPHSISSLLAKGDILRASNNFEKAISVYDEAITRVEAMEKPYWLIYFSRGICYDRIGQFDKTEADMKKALEISPNEPDVLNYLGYSWLTKRQNIEQAKKMIEEAYDARPEDAEIIDSMGYTLYIEGDFTSAQEYFEQALERIPNDPTINEHLGDAYWQLGHKVEANYQWRRALEDKPDEESKKGLLKKLENGIALITPVNTSDKKPKPPAAVQ